MDKRIAWVIAFVWALLVCASCAWNWQQVENSALEFAKIEARSLFEKDLVYRRWATMHGGVYVPPTQETPANPYLKNIPDRDVVTTGGKALTLINPSYMTRQVHELGIEQHGARGHITSLNPLRSENAPDAWERRALQAFEDGAKEMATREVIENKPFLRFMRPLITEKGCLICHQEQGYQVGQILGGLSISVPLDAYFASAGKQQITLFVWHVFIFISGILGLGITYRRVNHSVAEVRESEQKFHSLYTTMTEGMALHELISDASGKPVDYVFLDVNPAFESILGHKRQDVLGRKASEVFGSTIAPYLDRYAEVVKSGQSTRFESIFQPMQRTFLIAVFSPGQNHFATLFEDITERKQVEEALRKSEASFRNFFDKNSSVMLLIDPLSGKIIAANTAAIDYYKYPLDQLVGMSISEINRISPEFIAEEGQRALREGGNSYFFTHRLASGELRDVEVHLTPIESGGRSLLFSIVHDITERKKVEQKLEVLAQTDLLTGLANRRHFMTLAEQELSRTLRYGGALSVLMMDIDHFKIVNDTYGHQAGDLVLQKLGELCLETLREVDLVGRIGGEEFAVILPQTDGEKTLEVAERLRQAVERAEVQLEFGLPLHITLSIGVTTLTVGGTNIDTLLGQADNALYEAKHAGRNRVCVYRSPSK